MKTIALAMAMAVGVGSARAETPGSVSQFYGAFGTEIPISAPRFHGIEPQVKLNYNSGSQLNGFVGVGWGLAAASIIQRGGPVHGRGAPHYASSDVFLLDGQELMPFTALGGTHATRIQSYNRITHNADNTWTVTGKTGVQMTYQPLWSNAYPATVEEPGQEIYRWNLSQVRDTLGNVVNYSYYFDDASPNGDWYLDSIDYNGTSIQFYRGGRSDVTTYGSVAGITSVSLRLRSIVVRTGGALVRAYALGYVPSSDGRSLLNTVTQYGNDASVDAQGGISGGTSLPAFFANWNTPNGGFGVGGNFDTQISGQHIFYGSGVTVDRYSTFSTVDVNGDGRADSCIRLSTGVACALSTGSGWALSSGFSPGNQFPDVYDSQGHNTFDYKSLKFVDVNADGKADVCARSACGVQCWTSTGSSFSLPSGYDSCGTGQGIFKDGIGVDTASLRYADVNGDNRTDVCARRNGNLQCWLSTGSGWTAPAGFNQPLGIVVAPASIQFVDANGDGLADFCGADTLGVHPTCNLSNGNGWNPEIMEGYFPTAGFDSDNTGTVQFADVNGDGMADVCARLDSGEQCLLSTGHTFAHAVGYDPAHGLAINANNAPGAWSGASASTQFVDVNGDGKQDLCYLATDGLACYFSTGSDWKLAFTSGNRPGGNHQYTFSNDSFQFGYGTFDDDNLGTFRFGDVNGDGIADPCIRMDYGVSCAVSTGKPEMVTQLRNGMGAISDISYVPSTTYENTYLPLGMVLQTVKSVTTSDGHSTSSTVNYNYGGALWSNSEQTFLGFRYVKAVIDAAGDYTETYYHQHDGCISKPESTFIKTPVTTMASSTMTYSESATPPWTSLMTSRQDATCNGFMCRQTRTDLFYDMYGNVLQTNEYGNVLASGDERSTYVGYQYNLAAYIVSALAFQNTYVGLSLSGALLKSTRNVYDNNSSFQEAPTAGVLKRRQLWDSTTGNTVDSIYSVDAYGNVTSSTDPLGGRQTTVFDPIYHQFPVTECDALDHCASTNWDYALGVPLSRTDANQLTTSYSYDPLGRKVQTLLPDGNYVSWAYLSWGDPNQQRTRETHPDGSADGIWTDNYQDGLGRTYLKLSKSRVDSTVTNIQQDILYNDTSSRKWKESLPYAPGLGETPKYVQYGYDGMGRTKSVTNPDGSSSTTSYGGDMVGSYAVLWSQSKDELGHGRKVYQDAYGNNVKVTEYLDNGAQSFSTLTTVDMLGRTIQVTDAYGNASTMTWDSLDRKRTACDADMGCLTYGYDAVGHLTSQTDQNGNTITFTWDALGRPSTKILPGGKTVAWYYDEANHGASIGQLTAVVHPGGEEGYVYDVYGRPIGNTRCVQGICQTIKQSYDAYDRVATVTYPDCETVNYHYDEAGRQFAADGLATVQFNSHGRLHTVSNANGTTQTYGYDANRDWLSSSTVSAGATTLYQASYSYDVAARVTGIASPTDSLMVMGFGYDDLNRLTTVTGAVNQTMQYDAIGNISSNSLIGSYSYADGAHKHAVTRAGSGNYTYDGNGNMLTGPGRSMTWDAEDRLTSVTQGGATTSFDYDASGARIRRGGTYYFGGLIERSPSGELVKYYQLGGRLVARRDIAGANWYHGDHLGSTRLMTNSSGIKVASYAYAPFGQIIGQSSSVDNQIGFTGQRNDPESGLVYMNARYYDPVLARFISADTIIPSATNPQSYNRYSYVFNNPVSNVDPSGHLPVAAALIGAAYIAGTTTSAAIAAVAIAGAMFTTAGYYMHDSVISTVGTILSGIAGGAGKGLSVLGGIIGGGINALSSPLSPLSPGVKESIGWAYSAYGLGSGLLSSSPGEAADTPALEDKGYNVSTAGGTRVAAARLEVEPIVLSGKVSVRPRVEKLDLGDWELDLRHPTLELPECIDSPPLVRRTNWHWEADSQLVKRAQSEAWTNVGLGTIAGALATPKVMLLEVASLGRLALGTFVAMFSLSKLTDPYKTLEAAKVWDTEVIFSGPTCQ